MTTLIKHIYKYSKMIPTPLKLNLIYKYSNSNSHSDLLKQAKFMRTEIPIRLARMSVKLYELPYGLSNNRYISDVINLYNSSFGQIMNSPVPTNLYDCKIIANTLYDIKERHSNVHINVSKGVQEWVGLHTDLKNKLDINYFLDNFYMSRIGIRTLIGQYIGVEREQKGIIQTCYPEKIIIEAIHRASEACDLEYGDHPEVNIYTPPNIKLTYIPSHLFYIFFELLKNSMKAVMENNSHDNNNPYPKDIKVYISKGSKDLIIRITDFGGGFPRDNIDKVFNYAYTTTKQIISDNPYFTPQVILSGLGYGLPLSRLYCKYFKGDLQLIPYEGIGTDALIFINHLGDTNESI